ncbi:MAG: hypothetical protein ACI35V_12890 [Sphingobacterium composti]
MFSILSIFGCKTAERKLKIETVMGEYQKASRYAENGAHVRYNKLLPNIPLLEPKIDSIQKIDNILSYNLSGHIKSGGRTIYRIKNIQKEEMVQNDTLFIKHYVEIKTIPGKEGSLVVGYNYSQKCNQKVHTGIKKVHIELYHKYQNRDTNKVMFEEIGL